MSLLSISLACFPSIRQQGCCRCILVSILRMSYQKHTIGFGCLRLVLSFLFYLVIVLYLSGLFSFNSSPRMLLCIMFVFVFISTTFICQILMIQATQRLASVVCNLTFIACFSFVWSCHYFCSILHQECVFVVWIFLEYHINNTSSFNNDNVDDGTIDTFQHFA